MKARSRSACTPTKRSNQKNVRKPARWTKAAVLRQLKAAADQRVRAKMAYFGVDVPKAHGISAPEHQLQNRPFLRAPAGPLPLDRKSTRLNSSHVKNSYAVFCLK